METTSAQPVRDSKLRAFFAEQLQEMYWVEKKLGKRLLKLEQAATSQQLKSFLSNHQAQSLLHLDRLKEVFELMGEAAEGKKCPGMAGIMQESKDIIGDTDEDSAQRDVGVIFAAQKAAHYKIATYGGLAQVAKTLGFLKAKDLLGQTLADEKQADRVLSMIAEEGTNAQAGREEAEVSL